MNRCFCKVRLRVRESESMHLKVEDTEKIRFRADQYIKIRSGSYETYTGDYIVIPTAVAQVLDTDHKLLLDDVTVTAIPYTEVSNPSGGYTVSIG